MAEREGSVVKRGSNGQDDGLSFRYQNFDVEDSPNPDYMQVQLRVATEVDRFQSEARKMEPGFLQ